MKRVFVPSFFSFSLLWRFSSSEIRSPLFIISRSSSFSVIHVGVRIKIYSKKRLGFVAVSSFTPVYIKGWTYARTILSEEEIYWMPRQPNFLNHGSSLYALRARESSALTDYNSTSVFGSPCCDNGLWNVCTPTLDQNLVSNVHITVENSKHEGHAAYSRTWIVWVARLFRLIVKEQAILYINSTAYFFRLMTFSLWVE